MVQWLAHLTCNPGNAGSIPTHGISVFHSRWISKYFVLARDYIVGFPVLHSKYIYLMMCPSLSYEECSTTTSGGALQLKSPEEWKPKSLHETGL